MGRKEAGTQRDILGFKWKSPLTDTTWNLCAALQCNGLQVSLSLPTGTCYWTFSHQACSLPCPPRVSTAFCPGLHRLGMMFPPLGFRLPGTNGFLQQAQYLRRCGCHCSRLAGLTGPLHVRALGTTKHWGSRWLSGRACRSKHQSHLQAARP